MSDAVTIVIGGPTTAKGRPRMTRRGIAYTLAKTRRYEVQPKKNAPTGGDSAALDLLELAR